MIKDLVNIGYKGAMVEINNKYDDILNRLRDEYLTEKHKLSYDDIDALLSLQRCHFIKLKELNDKYFEQFKTVTDNAEACLIQCEGAMEISNKFGSFL